MKDRQFIKLFRELVASPAWQAQSIHCRRLIDFLMVEHLRRGGAANGRLKAPRRQLWAFGIGHHFVSSAIEEAEQLGLIDTVRGSRRIASTYALTWIGDSDGSPPSNRWRDCAGVAAENREVRKAAKTRSDASVMSAKQHSKVSVKQHSKSPLMSAKQHSNDPETCSAKQHSLYRDSYQGGGNLSVGEGEGVQAGEDVVVCPVTRDACDTAEVCRLLHCARQAPKTGTCPYRGCGKPAVVAGACAEHARPPVAAPSGKPNGQAVP